MQQGSRVFNAEMHGHSRAEMCRSVGIGNSDEDLDEYEEDGEEVEEDYEEEEEDPKPTKDELEYLELRQRLKEVLRKQMKKESGSVLSQSLEKKKKLPYDNYGFFFGPSQPVIARRVIQERKSILETQHLPSRASNSYHGNKKSPASTVAGAKPGVLDQPPGVINELKMKVQKLKVTRDYSFLLSDDTELPVPPKEPPPRKVSVPNSDARSAQVLSKSKQSMTKPSSQVFNCREERKPVSTNRQLQPKAGLNKLAASSGHKLTSADPRKQLGSNVGNGPGRPVGSKGLPSKLPAATMYKKASTVVAKNSVPGVHKTPLSKFHSSLPEQHLEKKKELQDPNKAKVMPKQMVSSKKSQIKPPKHILSCATKQENRPKKKPVYSHEDDSDEDGRAISMIRRMFRYNPDTFAGADDDVSDMEANFDDIQNEERNSAKIAREEDERELRLIEEEERREKWRKDAKKRKLGQR